jgi:hypothetical protein
MITEEDGDLIRRSDALGCFHDWVDKYGDVHTPDEMAEYRAIEELPSVEQEKRTEERTETHACDYERAGEQLEHDMLYEPTFNQDDGSI